MRLKCLANHKFSINVWPSVKNLKYTDLSVEALDCCVTLIHCITLFHSIDCPFKHCCFNSLSFVGTNIIQLKETCLKGSIILHNQTGKHFQKCSYKCTEGIPAFEQISGAVGELADKLTANNLLGSQIKRERERKKKKPSPKCQLQIIFPLISTLVKA